MGVTPGRAEQRFPGFDVLEQAGSWDDTTAAVVLGRLSTPGQLQFFDEREAWTARALLDRLLAQDDEPRVPVFEPIDARLAEGRGDGYRYADMPEDADAWRRSLAGLDEDAKVAVGRPFALLDTGEQMRLLEAVRTGQESWHGMPPKRVFSLWIRYACTAFYAHPWSWNEIGFGGPAYPRGYKNLGLARREHWEVPERDAIDPIPWIKQAEAARGRHSQAMGVSRDDTPPPPTGSGGGWGSRP